MSNSVPHEDEGRELVARIEKAIAQDTDDFNELTEILGLDPKTYFAGGNLSQFNLENADLSGADLHFCRLDQANLKNANLSNSNLRQVNSTNSDLTGANLTGVDLRGSDLTNSNLTDTILTKETLQAVELANVVTSYSEIKQCLEESNPSQLDYPYTNYTHLSNEELKSLVEAFCHQSPDTPQRNILACQLLREIRRLPNLNYSYQLSDRRFYDFVSKFKTALNNELMAIIQRICQFFYADETDYVQSLTDWINQNLRWNYNPEEKIEMLLKKVSKATFMENYTGIDDNEDNHFLFSIENLEDGLTLSNLDQMIENLQKQRHNQ